MEGITPVSLFTIIIIAIGVGALLAAVFCSFGWEAYKEHNRDMKADYRDRLQEVKYAAEQSQRDILRTVTQLTELNQVLAAEVGALRARSEGAQSEDASAAG